VRKEAGDFAGAADLLQTALTYDDTRVELWTELADCYRRLKQYDAAEAYLLEARRRAPDSLPIEAAYLNLGREHLTHDGYLARLEQARRRFPTNISLAYQLAHEFSLANVDRARTAAAWEDFLMLAAPDDPRRKEAEEYLRRR
jgi:thioredoxin-like negative regulator of GroEL